MRTQPGKMNVFGFGPIASLVGFGDGTERVVLDPLNDLLSDWNLRSVPSIMTSPQIVVRAVAGALRVDTPFLDEPVIDPDPGRIASNLAVDLLESYLAAVLANFERWSLVERVV